jgi:hypothetical protein
MVTGGHMWRPLTTLADHRRQVILLGDVHGLPDACACQASRVPGATWTVSIRSAQVRRPARSR